MQEWIRTGNGLQYSFDQSAWSVLSETPAHVEEASGKADKRILIQNVLIEDANIC